MPGWIPQNSSLSLELSWRAIPATSSLIPARLEAEAVAPEFISPSAGQDFDLFSLRLLLGDDTPISEVSQLSQLVAASVLPLLTTSLTYARIGGQGPGFGRVPDPVGRAVGDKFGG